MSMIIDSSKHEAKSERSKPKVKVWTCFIKEKVKLVCATLLVFLAMYLFYVLMASVKIADSLAKKKHHACFSSSTGLPLWEQKLDFKTLNFSNKTGNPSGCYLVPNYVHFLHFGGKPLTYTQLICVLAAFKNQKPEKMFFHYDNNKTFTGKYWDILENLKEFKETLTVNKIELPTEIFGKPLSERWGVWHGSDIERIRTLMKCGGAYIDNDCYIVKSLDDYRRFEMTLNWDDDSVIGNQVQIAHKDARFLKKYLDSYKRYDMNKWYYNAGGRPTVDILYNQPDLIHRVKVLFGIDAIFAWKVFNEKWEGWKDMYVIHLLARHQNLFKSLNEKATFPVEFNESNIAYYDVTFREMAYDVYDVAGIKWPKDRFNTEAGWPKR